MFSYLISQIIVNKSNSLGHSKANLSRISTNWKNSLVLMIFIPPNGKVLMPFEFYFLARTAIESSLVAALIAILWADPQNRIRSLPIFVCVLHCLQHTIDTTKLTKNLGIFETFMILITSCTIIIHTKSCWHSLLINNTCSHAPAWLLFLGTEDVPL